MSRPAAVYDGPRQFEIWWAELPDPVGRRPVLLLGRTAAFAYLTRPLVAEVTTTIRGILQEVSLGKREGLPRRCVANLDALRTVPRECLSRRIGRLAASRHVEVKRALGQVLHWPELTGLAIDRLERHRCVATVSRLTKENPARSERSGRRRAAAFGAAVP